MNASFIKQCEDSVAEHSQRAGDDIAIRLAKTYLGMKDESEVSTLFDELNRQLDALNIPTDVDRFIMWPDGNTYRIHPDGCVTKEPPRSCCE